MTKQLNVPPEKLAPLTLQNAWWPCAIGGEISSWKAKETGAWTLRLDSVLRGLAVTWSRLLKVSYCIFVGFSPGVCLTIKVKWKQKSTYSMLVALQKSSSFIRGKSFKTLVNHTFKNLESNCLEHSKTFSLPTSFAFTSQELSKCWMFLM